MYNAYLFTTDDTKKACEEFLFNQFQDDDDEDNGFIKKVLDIMNPEEFVRDYLLDEKYLDGEIVSEENKIGIFIKRDIRKFNLKDVEVELDLKKFNAIPEYILNSVYEGAYSEDNKLLEVYHDLAVL
jgi:hypothetical protein